jgi:hypothetical protein
MIYGRTDLTAADSQPKARHPDAIGISFQHAATCKARRSPGAQRNDFADHPE